MAIETEEEEILFKDTSCYDYYNTKGGWTISAVFLLSIQLMYGIINITTFWGKLGWKLRRQ